MENAYSISTVNNYYNNLLINNINQIELVDLFQDLISSDDYSNFEVNFLLLLLIDEIAKSSYLPLLKILAEQLKIKLIFAYQDNCKKVNQPTEIKAEEKNNCIECNKQEISQDELITMFWNFYTEKPFCPTEKDEYKLPPEGKTLNLKVVNTSLIPDKVYEMRFSVDPKGNVLKWIEYPRERLQPADFEKIYQGLLGQIMEYQKQPE